MYFFGWKFALFLGDMLSSELSYDVLIDAMSKKPMATLLLFPNIDKKQHKQRD